MFFKNSSIFVSGDVPKWSDIVIVAREVWGPRRKGKKRRDNLLNNRQQQLSFTSASSHFSVGNKAFPAGSDLTRRRLTDDAGDAREGGSDNERNLVGKSCPLFAPTGTLTNSLESPSASNITGGAAWSFLGCQQITSHQSFRFDIFQL